MKVDNQNRRNISIYIYISIKCFWYCSMDTLNVSPVTLHFLFHLMNVLQKHFLWFPVSSFQFDSHKLPSFLEICASFRSFRRRVHLLFLCVCVCAQNTSLKYQRTPPSECVLVWRGDVPLVRASGGWRRRRNPTCRETAVAMRRLSLDSRRGSNDGPVCGWVCVHVWQPTH